MMLIINRVYVQHFKTYIFEAENAIGRVTHELSLEQGKPYCFKLFYLTLICQLLHVVLILIISEGPA